MRSLQEIFNIAYLGLASQGFEKSVGLTSSCAYRGKDNHKCAIGYCLSDEDYNEEMEGRTALSDIVYYALKTNVNPDTLVEMQRCHDFSNDPTNRKEEFVSFAKHYRLTIPKELVL